jgi:hypothetical protein
MRLADLDRGKFDSLMEFGFGQQFMEGQDPAHKRFNVASRLISKVGGLTRLRTAFGKRMLTIASDRFAEQSDLGRPRDF